MEPAQIKLDNEEPLIEYGMEFDKVPKDDEMHKNRYYFYRN